MDNGPNFVWTPRYINCVDRRCPLGNERESEEGIGCINCGVSERLIHGCPVV